MDVERETDPEDPSLPGDLYEDASPELRGIFHTADAIVEGPVADEWGVWVSGLAPVLHPERHEVLAVFGMDIDASDWNRLLWDSARKPVAITLIFLLIAALGHLQSLRTPATTRTFRYESLFAPPPQRIPSTTRTSTATPSLPGGTVNGTRTSR
jgi:hypothetical protein